MSFDRNCTICLTDLNTDHKTESIFSIDSKAKTCLAYKIFQMTGVQMIQQNVGEFTCEDCHNILVMILDLEKEFANKFHMLNKNADLSAKDFLKLKQEICAPKTLDQNIEDNNLDLEKANLQQMRYSFCIR